MRILWKLFILVLILSVVGLICGIVLGKDELSGLSIGLLIILGTAGFIFSIIEYSFSFSDVPLLKAEFRIWSNHPKTTLYLYTKRGTISIEPEKIEISVNPNAEVVLLTVGSGRFFNLWSPQPVIVTVPSEEIKERWQDKIVEAQLVAKERYEKLQEKRRESKKDLLPKPDKIPTIRPKSSC